MNGEHETTDIKMPVASAGIIIPLLIMMAISPADDVSCVFPGAFSSPGVYKPALLKYPYVPEAPVPISGQRRFR